MEEIAVGLATEVRATWADVFATRWRKPLLVAAGLAVLQQLTGMVTFIASFAFSLGPVVWTVINEVFPAQVRGKGVATATALNWFAAWLVTQFFLSVVEWTSTSGAFLIFAFFCGVTLWFVARHVPETKGRTLEEIQEMWDDPDLLQQALHEHR